MFDLRSIAVRSGGALTIVAVAALAAALSHAVIDAVGDVLLRHDTYDDVAHDSRVVMAVAAIAILLAAGARSVYDALRSALGRNVAVRAFRIASPRRFVGAVIALAIPFVLAMEAGDAAVAGRVVDDLGDLFGGSILLGLGSTLGVACSTACAAVAALRFFCSTHRFLVRALIGFFELRRRTLRPTSTGIAGRPAIVVARPLLNRYAAKRGPPLLVLTASLVALSFQQFARSFFCFSFERAYAVRGLSSLR